MAGRFAHARHRDRAVPPQVDLVQVGLEDLVLGVAGVQDHRQDRFDRLAPERALWGRVLWSQVEVLDELLRERGAALPGASLHVRDHGADAAADRDAGVPVEVAVFGHQDGVGQRARHLRQAHERAVLELIPEDRSQPLRFDGQRRNGRPGGVADRPDAPPREVHAHRVAAEEPPRIPEVAREDFHHAAVPAVMSGAGGSSLIALVEKAIQSRHELLGRAAVSLAQHEHVGINSRGQVPATPLEARDDQGSRIDDDPEPRDRNRREYRQDLHPVAMCPEVQRNPPEWRAPGGHVFLKPETAIRIPKSALIARRMPKRRKGKAHSGRKATGAENRPPAARRDLPAMLAALVLLAVLAGTGLFVDSGADASFDAPKRLTALVGAATAFLAAFGFSRWENPLSGAARPQRLIVFLSLGAGAWALLSALLSLRPALSLDATRAILLTALFLPLGASRVVGRSRPLLVSVFLAV